MVGVLACARPKLFGDGRNVRDWIHTEDHSSAVWAVNSTDASSEHTCLVGAGRGESFYGERVEHCRV